MVLDRVGPPLPCGVVWVLSCGFSAAPRGFWRPLRSPSPVVWRGFVGVVGSGPLGFLEVCGPCCAVCPPSFAGGVGGGRIRGCLACRGGLVVVVKLL